MVQDRSAGESSGCTGKNRSDQGWSLERVEAVAAILAAFFMLTLSHVRIMLVESRVLRLRVSVMEQIIAFGIIVILTIARAHVGG
jgi:hypothetical protein